MIIPVFKPLGASTHQLAKKIGELYQTKATHTGTLDPMAEGVVIVLCDQDRFQKEAYSNFKKTYEVKLLLGVSTDSDDLLGLITTRGFSDAPVRESLIDESNKIVGNHTQIIHPFSAKRTQGVSFFDVSKKGMSPPAITEPVELFSIDVLDQEQCAAEVFTKIVRDKISRVEGEFRQIEVLKGWETLLSEEKNTQLTIIRIKIVCSKRTYIRSLVRYLSTKIGHPLTVVELVRTRNGPYSIADCMCLI